jgi:hypothetical protein
VRYHKAIWAPVLQDFDVSLLCIRVVSLGGVLLALVCVLSLLYADLEFISHQTCKGARDSNLWRSLWGDSYWDKEDRDTQVYHRITWEGLSATLVHRDTTMWSRQAFKAWPNRRIKSRVFCAFFFAIVSFSLSSSIHLQYCSKFISHLVRAIKLRELLSFSLTWILVCTNFSFVIQVCVYVLICRHQPFTPSRRLSTILQNLQWVGPAHVIHVSTLLVLHLHVHDLWNIVIN